MRGESEFLGNIVTFALIVVISLLLQCRGVLVDESVAIRAAEIQGFTNVKVVDRAWFGVGFRGCGKLDAVRFTIKASNPLGNEVECYVCSGWLFKAATIRTK